MILNHIVNYIQDKYWFCIYYFSMFFSFSFSYLIFGVCLHGLWIPPKNELKQKTVLCKTAYLHDAMPWIDCRWHLSRYRQ